MWKRGEPTNTVKKVSIPLAISCALLRASCLVFGASPVFFENFDDGVADRFAEAGGTWSVVDGKYVQSTTNPPGPHRSWVSALSEYVIDVDFVLLSGQEAGCCLAMVRSRTTSS